MSPLAIAKPLLMAAAWPASDLRDPLHPAIADGSQQRQRPVPTAPSTMIHSNGLLWFWLITERYVCRKNSPSKWIGVTTLPLQRRTGGPGFGAGTTQRRPALSQLARRAPLAVVIRSVEI